MSDLYCRHVEVIMQDVKPQALKGDWAKLGKLIRDIRVALLTTVDPDGHFHTRPVQTLQLEGHDTLWFFTDWSSPKVHELHRDVRVSLRSEERRVGKECR